METEIYRWLFLLITLSTWTLIESKEMRIVCYYTNWSVYRPGQAKFSPQNINPYLCTHLVYAFGGFTKENTFKPFDKYQDIEKGGYAKFTGLKTYNKNLKTLIAIGGWNEGSSRFSPMVANAERRKELVKNAVKFLRQNHFDGLDLDWEYPTFRDGGKPRDRDNYAQLVMELREEFDRESEKTGRPRLLLTMAVPAGIEYINKGYDVPKLTRYLDWMNILSYDYHSAFEPAVNHHAPLFSLEEDSEYNYDAELNIDYTIKHYLKMGADASKLVLGIPTYGRSYTLFNPDANEIGAPADGPGDMGEATRENGYLAYYEICESVKDQEWEVVQPNPEAMGPYAFKGNQWVGYDDEDIVRRKARYVVENGIGGIMFWAIDNDDFRGNCHGKPYPLIEAGKEAMIEAYGTTDDNLISPPSKPIKPKPKGKTRTAVQKSTTPTSETGSPNRRRRIKPKPVSDEDKVSSASAPKRRKESFRKPDSITTSTHSSLKIATPSYTTPAPPSTPDMGGAFKCEDEGFFPHPKDCKKYFWCLAGAGDNGIVAHQFTCPAGLYFNKAADSCDYTQNVLCNKKLQKATTTSSTTTSTEQSTSSATTSKPNSIFTTTRRLFRQSTTTTTEAPEEEYYEYEDEDAVEGNRRGASEEDPKVIKELIDLIRKAGGIEELEKQLKIDKNAPSSSVDTTTQSAISKSLYERVLSKTSKNALNALRKSSSRNSSGPQNDGLKTDDELEKRTNDKRPQYKTLTRQRASTEKVAEEDPGASSTEKAAETLKPFRSFKAKNSLEYVNIRRAKSSTTTEPSEDSRNKILGEIGEGLEDEGNEDEAEDGLKRSNVPKYVNIRRQRPSTTESSTTVSKYVTIRRSTTPPAEAESDATEKYKTVRKGTTTESNQAFDEFTSKYQTISRSTTAASREAADEQSSATVTTSSIEEENDVTAKYQTISRSSSTQSTTILSTESPNTAAPSATVGNTVTPSGSLNSVSVTEKNVLKIKRRPALFQPRPFSSSSSTEPTTITEPTKTLSTATPRPLFRVGPRRRNSTSAMSATTKPTSRETITSSYVPIATKIGGRKPNAEPLESQVTSTQRTTPLSARFKFVARKNVLKTATSKKTTSLEPNADQTLEPSNHQSQENNSNSEETKKLADGALALQSVQKAPAPGRKRLQSARIKSVFSTPRSVTPNSFSTAGKGFFTTAVREDETISPQINKKYVTTLARLPSRSRFRYSSSSVPLILITTPKATTDRRRKPSVKAFDKISAFDEANTYRPLSEYDYYDDLQASILSRIPEHSKVLVHSDGRIECLDQGNFPHPVSCKKFISCAKMEHGKVIGWEYTCPKNLSFDPIGGMCNWSAGLGCVE